MKNKLIYFIAGILGVAIVVIMTGDFLSDEKKNEGGNPFAYDVDEFKAVDPGLIHYKEIKRIGLSIPEPVALDVYNDRIGIGFNNHLQVVDTNGLEIINKSVKGAVSAISFAPDGNIFLAYHDTIEIFDASGETMDTWEAFGDQAVITAIAFKDTMVYVADAGNRKVFRLNRNGKLIGDFDGTGRLEGNYGFILPSPYFDLEVDPYEELWVVNSGLLKVENYTDEGTIRAFWGKPSFEVDGFTGCCNPAHIAILPDGSFVTSEKGLPRIKVYKPSGELESVVATPADFDAEKEPADVAVDAQGNIYALDMALNKVRVFKKI